jgi:hypothetical protein
LTTEELDALNSIFEEKARAKAEAEAKAEAAAKAWEDELGTFWAKNPPDVLTELPETEPDEE